MSIGKPPAKSGKDSTAAIGFEAKLWLTADTALPDSATLRCEAILRSLSEAKDNRSNNMGTADWSGATKTAAGDPLGGRGGARQPCRPGDPTRELSIDGVEKTDETGRLCRLNLAAN